MIEFGKLALIRAVSRLFGGK